MSTPRIRALQELINSGTLLPRQLAEAKRRVKQYQRLYDRRHTDDASKVLHQERLRRALLAGAKRVVANLDTLRSLALDLQADLAAHAPACASDAAPEGESLPGQGEVDEAELARLIHS